MGRKTVTFTEHDAEMLAELAREDAPAYRALRELAGSEPRSESAIVRALVRLGLERVREAELAAGYAQLEEGRTDDDEEVAEALLRASLGAWSE